MIKIHLNFINLLLVIESDGGISKSVSWSVRTPAIVFKYILYLLEIPPDLKDCDEAGDILIVDTKKDSFKDAIDITDKQHLKVKETLQKLQEI